MWITIPYLFFSIAETKMQGYTLFTAPAIFIITALFWQYLNIYRRRFKYKWVILTIQILLIALPVRYSIERLKPFQKINRTPQWVQNLKQLKRTTDKKVLFNVKTPIEIMFYTDFIAYEKIPSITTINNLSKKGYNIYINDNGIIDPRIKKLKNINLIYIIEN